MSSDEIVFLEPPPPPPTLPDKPVNREEGELSSEDGDSEVEVLYCKKERRSVVVEEKPEPDDAEICLSSDDDDAGVSVSDELFFEDRTAGDDAEEVEQPEINAHGDASLFGIDLTDPTIFNTPNSNLNCFNCLGAHSVADCKQPIDNRRIEQRRRKFREQNNRTTAREVLSTYTPGTISKELRKALNIRSDEYPEWVVRMRRAGPLEGYPPGYLELLTESEKKVHFFTTDTSLSTVAEKEFALDESLIVYYDGFNVINPKSRAEREFIKSCNIKWKPYTKESYAAELKDYVFQHILDERRQSSVVRQSVGSKRHFAPPEDVPPPKRARQTEAARPHVDVDSPASPDQVAASADDLLLPASAFIAPQDDKSREFFVAKPDDRKMPDYAKFAEGITPFRVDNVMQKGDFFEKLREKCKQKTAP